MVQTGNSQTLNNLPITTDRWVSAHGEDFGNENYRTIAVGVDALPLRRLQGPLWNRNGIVFFRV